METWKAIPNYPGYEVSSSGRCRSRDRLVECHRNGKVFYRRMPSTVLKPGKATNGYLTVSLGRNNSKTVHSLVAAAFLGERPKGLDVAHLDGCKLNNSASNLAYITRSENNYHFHVHGRTKIPSDVVRRIRKSKNGPAALAREYGVSVTHVCDILNNRVRKRG